MLSYHKEKRKCRFLGYVHTVPASETERRRSVPDRASVHTRNAAFEAVSAPEQYCSAPLLKVGRSVSDRFLKLSKSSLNTFITLGSLRNNFCSATEH